MKKQNKIYKILKKPSKEQRLWEIINSINRPFLIIDKWPNEIFFFRDNTFLFSYDTKNGDLWCSYNNVWKIFEEEHGMGYYEIQSLIKTEVENTFKMKGVTPEWNCRIIQRQVENTFKMKGVTPQYANSPEFQEVENTFKMKGITP